MLRILVISLCTLLLYLHIASATGVLHEENNDEKWVRELHRNAVSLSLEDLKEKYSDLLRLEGQKPEDLSFNLSLEPKATLRVFVSESMPMQLLKSYAKEAEQYNAVLVFKGLPKGSFKELAKLVQAIQGNEGKAVMQLDDEAFDKFGITAVPTFVLSIEEDNLANQINQSSKITYDKISGNIGIKYALEKFARNGELKREAEKCLKR